jgi:Fe-S-cluster containining protein
MINQAQDGTTPCARCGNCCRWPGYVRVLPDEVEGISRFLGLAPAAFTGQYTRLLPARTGLSLTETATGACVFLEGNACRIHAVKPRQCRDFPAAWSREEVNAPCQMIKND